MGYTQVFEECTLCISDDRIRTLDVAVGALAALVGVLILTVILLAWLVVRSRREHVVEEPEDSPPPVPRGVRPCASDIAISGANQNGLTGSKQLVYAPMRRSTGRLHSSQTYIM